MWERETEFEEVLEKGIKKTTKSSIDEVVALAIDEEKWVKFCPARDSKYLNINRRAPLLWNCSSNEVGEPVCRVTNTWLVCSRRLWRRGRRTE